MLSRQRPILQRLAVVLTVLLIVLPLSACTLLAPSDLLPGSEPTNGAVVQSNPTESSGQTHPDESSAGPLSPPGLTDYFPLTPDVFLDYDGTGNEYVPMKVWVEYVTADSIQLSYDNGGTEVHRLLRISDGQVRQIASVAEVYVREDLSLLEPDPDGEILLQEPLSVGSSWKVDGQTRLISALNVPVSTPAGDFEAIEVTTEGENTTTRHYYAPGVGLVKMTVTGEYEITQTLRQRVENQYRIVPMTFYYGRLTQTDSEILFKEIDVELRTNYGIRELLTRYFRSPIDPDLPPLISENTQINQISLDPGSGVVTADFSPELVTEMNAGSTFEAVIIRCIVNTIGHAYGADKVSITLDGRPYESGHIALGPGEYFGVDDEGMIEIP